MTDLLAEHAARVRAGWETDVAKGLALCKVPERYHEGLTRYAIDGGLVGQFLTAVIDNNLREAVSRADDPSLAALKSIVQFFYNYTPGRCHGRRELREKWRATGGLAGMEP